MFRIPGATGRGLYPVRALAHERFRTRHPIVRQRRRFHPSVRWLAEQNAAEWRYQSPSASNRPDVGLITIGGAMRLLLFSDLHLDTAFGWAGPALGDRLRTTLRATLDRIAALAEQ